MNYKAGDTVVCIDARYSYPVRPEYAPILGHKYVVYEKTGQCVLLVGATVPAHLSPVSVRCSNCGQSAQDLHWHYHQWRFIKLDGLTEQETSQESITA